MILFWTQLENSLGAVTRIKDFTMETANENADDDGNPNLHSPLPPDWPPTGAIQIDNLYASYDKDPASRNSNKALDNITLSIPARSKIGICGRTGSGKSSLILTLLRLLDPIEGGIRIDGVNIKDISRQELRERVIVIGQEGMVVLPGGVRGNLGLYGKVEGEGAENGDGRIREVLREVGLWETIEEKVQVDLEKEFREDMLSHGQRQLFGLARAILRKDHSASSSSEGGERGGKLLILDEATSSVDVDTQKRMQETIEKRFGDCTIVAIAHRLETICGYDAVVVMDRGRVVEVGKPEELLLLGKKDGEEEGGTEGGEEVQHGRRWGWFRKLWEEERHASGSSSRQGDDVTTG